MAGARLAVIIGGVTMAAGHFMLAFGDLFYPALVTIAVGNGFFLPSLPSQIASLYAPGDRRRASAYNVYYVGVNVGGFLAPLLCGILGETFGWHWGFGAAGVGMVIGLAVYVSGRRWLPQERPRIAAEPARSPPRGMMRQRWQLILATVFAVVIFRGAYAQLGNTIALWAKTDVDRLIGSFAIPITWFQSVNSLFVLVLTPLLLFFWNRRARAGREMTALVRMATGAWIVALAYAAIGTIATFVPAGEVSWVWLFLFLVTVTLGELWILPVGLGLFGRLAPFNLAATTMAAWYSASFAGNLLAGLLGSTWSDLGASRFFVLMAGVALFAGLLLRLLDRPARRVEQAAGYA